MNATRQSYVGPNAVSADGVRKRKLSRDDAFFIGMSVLIVITVFLGFARTYYLAPMYHTHVRSALIAVHGAAFTTWIVLFVTQTSLIASRHVAWHKRLGIFGAGLAVAMLVLGLTAATDSLSRGFAPPGTGFDPRTFYAVPVLEIMRFGVLVAAALVVRADGAAHKRLMLLATIGLTDAAIGRWPFAFVHHPPVMESLLIDALVLAVVGFDFWSRGRIHRVTVAGGLFTIVIQHATIPIGMTPLWLKFAGMMQAAWMRL